MKIMIAEDEPLVARDLSWLVRSLGHQVVATVDTGRRAVEEARALAPELLLLDIALPGLDGIGVAREVLAIRPMPIIMVTAHADPDLVERAATAGVMSYLLKPVTESALRAGIQVARARFEELQALSAQVRGLTEALEVRKIVEQAKGILMKRLQLSEAEAFRRLQRRAAAERRPLQDIALAVREADRFFGEMEQGA